MARSEIAWSSGARTLVYSGSTAPEGSTQRGEGWKKQIFLMNCHFVLCVLFNLCSFTATYWNPHVTDPLFHQRQCSPQSPIKHEWMNESPFDSFRLFFPSLLFRLTYSVHALPIKRHHGVGCVAHEDTFVTDVIWGALDRHHGLTRQSEIIPLESFTARHKWK